MYRSTLEYLQDSGDTLAFLIDAYISAERRGAQTFQNAVIRKIASVLKPNGGTLFDVVNPVFAETTHTSKLRRLVVDVVAWEGQAVAFQSPEVIDAVPPAFAFGVYSAIHARTKGNAIPTCAYSQSSGPHILRCGNSSFCKAENAYGAKLCLADRAEAPYRRNSPQITMSTRRANRASKELLNSKSFASILMSGNPLPMMRLEPGSMSRTCVQSLKDGLDCQIQYH